MPFAPSNALMEKLRQDAGDAGWRRRAVVNGSSLISSPRATVCLARQRERREVAAGVRGRREQGTVAAARPLYAGRQMT